MRIVILGCTRLGVRLAVLLDAEGHELTVVDWNVTSFLRLPPKLRDRAVLGNGLDQGSLKKAGVDRTDVFIAVTDSDNHNAVAGQIAKYIFNVRKVLCRFDDPVHREVYDRLGLEAVDVTALLSKTIGQMLEER